MHFSQLSLKLLSGHQDDQFLITQPICTFHHRIHTHVLSRECTLTLDNRNAPVHYQKNAQTCSIPEMHHTLKHGFTCTGSHTCTFPNRMCVLLSMLQIFAHFSAFYRRSFQLAAFKASSLQTHNDVLGLSVPSRNSDRQQISLKDS